MPMFTLQELLVEAVETVKLSWAACLPLLQQAFIIAAGIGVALGLFTPSDLALTWMAVPTGALTIIVSAGVAGFLLTGERHFLTAGGVLNEPRCWNYVGRLIMVALILFPIALVFAGMSGALAGMGSGMGLVIGSLFVVAGLLYVYARVVTFPYNVFLPGSPGLQPSWQSTTGAAVPIIGLVTIFQVGILLAITLIAFVAQSAVGLLQGATGLSGGVIVQLVVQAGLQISAAFILDCALITIVRKLQPRLNSQT